MYGPKKLALNSFGVILLFLGGVVFIVEYGGNQSELTLQDSQFAVGGVLIAILGIFLLWRGSKIKDYESTHSHVH